MLYPKMVYRLIPKRLRQFVNGWCQPMALKCEASLGLAIIIKDSSRNMHRWPNPLYKLISGENAAKKKNLIKWDLECQEAFDKLKELCTTTPILAYADFGKPFKLHTNASVLGLGVVLYQVQDWVEKVISYASQSLTKSEAKYPVHKLEFLCLKWAITNQFHESLYGNTLMSIQITTPWHMYWLLLNWMPWVINGLLAWLPITFISITNQGKVMWKQMPCHRLIERSVITPSRLIPFKQ